MRPSDARDLAGTRVMVTGATGFIGSHLVAALASRGADVCAVATDLGWREPVRTLVERGDVRFVAADILGDWRPSLVADAFHGVDSLVHLAYLPPTGDEWAQRTHHELGNVRALLRLLDQAPGTVRRVCLASSVSVYGDRCPVPVAESHAPAPTTAYGVGKLAAEHLVRTFALERGIASVALRYSTVYGSMETDPRAIPSFIRAGLAGRPSLVRGTGADVRDFIHVADAVKATALALRRPLRYDTFNVGSGRGRRVAEVAAMVAERLGAPEPTLLAGPGPTTLIADVSRARAELGFEPSIAFEDGLDEEIEWFQHRPELWAVPEQTGA